MSLHSDLFDAETLRDDAQKIVLKIQDLIAKMKADEAFCNEVMIKHEREMLCAIELIERVQQSAVDTISEIEEDLEDEEDDE